jgi:uncharacterized protein (DUF302 family)
LGFGEAIEKVTEALKSEGFGILTEIDVTETLKIGMPNGKRTSKS